MPRYSFLGRPLKVDPDAMSHSEKLHKMLADAGLGSRRDMESMIGGGTVTINGKAAKVGDRVTPKDVVRVGGRIVNLPWEKTLPRVLIYHKQEGEIVSRDDPEGRPSVFANLPRLKGKRWISIGRLDFNTEGLLIFTTSGELANRLSHPRYEVEREYAVRVLGELTQEQMDTLTSGVELEDGTAVVESIFQVGGEGANQWYQLIIKEGRNREVRRLFDALGLTVSRLIRVRFGPVTMPSKLKRGMLMELTDQQVAEVIKWCGLETAHQPSKPAARKHEDRNKVGHPYRRRMLSRNESR